MKSKNSYLPVDPDFYDILLSFTGKDIKVFYFEGDQNLEESKGRFLGIVENENGEFTNIKNGIPVRLDRIITINGKPGPAFEEYDGYANACFSCLGGYDDENEM